MNGFNIGVSGLKAAQVGLDVTAHNIANVHTPNFRRQMVDLEEVSYPDGIKSTPDGAGVAVADIHQVTDPFLERILPDALSKKDEADKYNDLIGPLNEMLNNPALNIPQAFQDVFNSFQDVANNPTNIAIRQNALQKSQDLVDKVNNVQIGLSDLNTSLNKQRTDSVSAINDILSNLKSLYDNQIATGNNKDSATMSNITTSIYNLAEKVGINVSDDKRTIVMSNGKTIMQNGIPNYISEKDLTNVSGGQIGGINKFQSEILNPTMQKLPQVTNKFYNEINSQAVLGYDLNGNQGQQIFNNIGGNVSVLKDPHQIGASSTINPSMNNGDNAQLISDIRYKKFNGEKLTDAYSGILTDLASKQASSKDLGNMYDGIYNDYKSKLDAISGVNLDEEGVNLMKYQRMYEANAQVIKTQNEMLGTLLNIKA